MSLFSKMAERIKALDRRLWPAHRVAMNREMAAVLREHKMILADVGSAGGPEELWLGLEEYIHFLTFDPNPRPSQGGNYAQATNFPVGLWSTNGKMNLHVTSHPDSSSLLPINTPFFSEFIAKSGMEEVASASIEVDTLDRLLTGKPELSPDFLKLDVEGGELEVLKGSLRALSDTVLGLKIETAFVEMQMGRPLLWQIDEFMRSEGFTLFNVGRNYWIRNNRMHGYSSQPQLIWGDAIYFLSRESFLRRLTAGNNEQRKILLTKFVVLLLRYGVHDYTWDIIEASTSSGMVPASFADDVKTAVKDSMDTSGWYFINGALGLMFAFLVLILSLPAREPRIRGVFYVKQRARRLFYDLTRLAVLGGRGHNACLEDPFV